jgi:hypothetical protein
MAYTFDVRSRPRRPTRLQGKNEDNQEPRMDENEKIGVPVAHPTSRAANEEFSAPEQGQDGTAGVQRAWDPYEVWRTRVRETLDLDATRERKR